ncbi:MAG: S-layer homology domain-containing protein [Bacillota bacterium]
MSKKIVSLLLVLLLLLTNISMVMASDNIEDVPNDHWAYESVAKLVDQGYMSLYDGNKFEGENKVSRYELAEVIAKMLANVNQGQVDPESDDLLSLKNLATEFRSELVEVVNQNEKLEQKLNDLDDDQEVNQEDIVNTNAKINDLRKQVDQILNSITEEAIRTNKLKKKLDKLAEKNSNLEEKVGEMSSELENKNTETKVEELERRFFWLTGGWIVSTLLLTTK